MKKIIVVTGGAGLLGRKHAEAIAALGGKPVILDTNLEAGTICLVSIRVSHEKISCLVFTVITTSSNEAFPALSPNPFIVHSTCLAPFITADKEFATAKPRSL